MEEYLLALRNYFNFRGTSSIREFWKFFQIHVLIIVGLYGLRLITPDHGIWGILVIAHALYALALLVPLLSASTRRLRDAGQNPWLVLIGFIPLVNFALLFILAKPTQHGEGAVSGTHAPTPPSAPPERS
ncbi:DUF805 domain-containing protein [Patescibacteria group bacterium]|nr:DUF805 domain-containing protein [Patescibacteria group bacterium]